MTETDYHRRRAEAERQMAQIATDPAAARVHSQLAEFHLDRIRAEAAELAAPRAA